MEERNTAFPQRKASATASAWSQRHKSAVLTLAPRDSRISASMAAARAVLPWMEAWATSTASFSSGS